MATPLSRRRPARRARVPAGGASRATSNAATALAQLLGGEGVQGQRWRLAAARRQAWSPGTISGGRREARCERLAAPPEQPGRRLGPGGAGGVLPGRGLGIGLTGQSLAGLAQDRDAVWGGEGAEAAATRGAPATRQGCSGAGRPASPRSGRASPGLVSLQWGPGRARGLRRSVPVGRGDGDRLGGCGRGRWGAAADRADARPGPRRRTRLQRGAGTLELGPV